MALFGPRAAASLAVYAHEHDHAHDLAGEVVPQDAAAEGEPPTEGARHAEGARRG
jgi:hypothetical protein